MIILVGESASGKTEVVKDLVNNYHYQKLVTYTTRLPREGEVEGRDYHFVSLPDFVTKISNGFFFEYVNYNGNFYGTAKADLNDQSVVILEPNGFKSYKEKGAHNPVSFYLSSSEEKRIERMRYRKDPENKIKERILNDRNAFKKESLEGIDYVIDSNDLTVPEMAKEIDQIYQAKLKEISGR